MGIVQKNEISLELEHKSYDEICSPVVFHKKYNIFFPSDTSSEAKEWK